MHVTTSTHILTLGEDHVYTLRKLGMAGDDSWLETRRGEAFDRRLRVQLAQNSLELFFENKSIGVVPLSNAAGVKDVIALVEHWNEHIGPTDLQTTKTVELLKEWPRVLENKEFKLKCVTYNCAGLLADMALKRETWLQLLGKEEETNKLDIIVLSFQESDSLNRVKNSYITLNRVCDLSRQYLFKSHTLISSVQLLGLMTVVFVKNRLAQCVSDLHTSTSSTGFLRVWGNKGAVLTRFKLFADEVLGNGHEFVFVNCHLSAGEGITQLGRRKWELREIGSKFHIPDLAPAPVEDEEDTTSISDISSDEEEHENTNDTSDTSKKSETASLETANLENVNASDDASTIVEGAGALADSKPENKLGQLGANGKSVSAPSSIVVLMGDLNYRVLLSESEGLRKAQAHEWEGLLARDSLLLERRQGLVFPNFEEAQISFPPTYKYDPGTRKLRGRVPSYTDRIMYRTECKTHILSYKSLENCILSDHRPVALSGTVESPCCINPEVTDEITHRAMMIADTAENNARPKIDVENSTIVFSGPPLSVVRTTIIVRNKGSRPVSFVVENAQIEADKVKTEDDKVVEKAAEGNTPEGASQQKSSENLYGGAVDIPPLPLIRPESTSMSPTGDVILTPAEGRVSASKPIAQLVLEARIGLRNRDLILLVKPKPHENEKEQSGMDASVQRYVFVKIEPTKSVLGTSISDLPIGEDTGGVPTPIFTLCEYLRPLKRTVPNLFVSQSEPTLFHQILGWVDSGLPLDKEVLSAANRAKPYAGDYAVAQVLLTIFYYLPEQLLGPSAKRRQASKLLKHTVMYVCKLITELVDTENIDEIKTLDVWASALYDRNDRKAREVEKRAYLRSMLIVATTENSK